MKQLCLTLMMTMFLMSNAIANEGETCEGCASTFVAVEKTEIDPDVLEGICSSAEMKNFDLMMEFFELFKLDLAENYLDIDCSKTGRVGPTLLHMILNGSSKLFSLAQDIVHEIKKAKAQNPALDTASYFNMKEPFFSKKRTVVGIIDRTIKTVKQGGILHEELLDIRKTIIELGAKP